MRKSLLTSLSLALLSIAAAVHADTASMTVKGSKQGDIKGGGQIKGRVGAIECEEVGFEVASPRDVATGQATGKRQYKPLRCVKRVDRASPPLFSALTTNEVLSSVTLDVWGMSDEGQPTKIYTVALKSANVASLRLFLDKGANLMEEVTFSFASISVTSVQYKLSAEDTLLRAAQ